MLIDFPVRVPNADGRLLPGMLLALLLGTFKEPTRKGLSGHGGALPLREVAAHVGALPLVGPK